MKIGEYRWPLIMAYKKKGLTAKLRGELIDFRPNERRALSRILRVPQKKLFKE